jgi:hypothetical protein
MIGSNGVLFVNKAMKVGLNNNKERLDQLNISCIRKTVIKLVTFSTRSSSGPLTDQTFSTLQP